MSDSNHPAPRLFGIGAVLPVDDIAATARWYCDVLGFALDFVMDGHGSVVRCNVGIQFTTAPAGFHPRDYPGWTYIFTENIDPLFDEYRTNGAKITRELATHAHGMREFQIEDCNGYTLRFGQYLSDSQTAKV